MKHLKKFENFDVIDTENPEISSTKTIWNQMNGWISQFQSNKAVLDTLYMEYNDIKELRTSLLSKSLITKDDDGIKFENPLLNIWANISQKRRNISNIEKSVDLLENTLRENAKRLGENRDLKETIDEQDTNIKNSILTKNNSISDMNREITKYQSEITNKLNEIKTKLKEGLKTLK